MLYLSFVFRPAWSVFRPLFRPFIMVSLWCESLNWEILSWLIQLEKCWAHIELGRDHSFHGLFKGKCSCFIDDLKWQQGIEIILWKWYVFFQLSLWCFRTTRCCFISGRYVTFLNWIIPDINYFSGLFNWNNSPVCSPSVLILILSIRSWLASTPDYLPAIILWSILFGSKMYLSLNLINQQS